MTTMHDPNWRTDLSRAEEAERQEQERRRLAASAPALREQRDAETKREQRQRRKERALEAAREGMVAVRAKQAELPEAYKFAWRALAAARTIEQDIQKLENAVVQELLLIDKEDFLDELEAAEAQERALGRDPNGARYQTTPRQQDLARRGRSLLAKFAPDYRRYDGVPTERPTYQSLIDFVQTQF